MMMDCPHCSRRVSGSSIVSDALVLEHISGTACSLLDTLGRNEDGSWSVDALHDFI